MSCALYKENKFQSCLKFFLHARSSQKKYNIKKVQTILMMQKDNIWLRRQCVSFRIWDIIETVTVTEQD